MALPEFIFDNMVWSYSRIKAFENCRYGWYLKYIKDCKGQEMFYASYGKFIHKLLELYYKGEIPKEELTKEFLINFGKEVKGERPLGNVVEKYIKSGMEYFNSFKPFSLNTLGVETKSDFKVGDYDFVGFIDYIGENENGIYIVDHKSGDIKPRSNRKKPTLKDKELDEKLRQLYLYSSEILSKYGEYPTKLCFNCFRTGTWIEEPFRAEEYQKALCWARKRIEEIKVTDDFTPQINYFYCRNICDQKENCCYCLNS